MENYALYIASGNTDYFHMKLSEAGIPVSQNDGKRVYFMHNRYYVLPMLQHLFPHADYRLECLGVPANAE